MNNLQLIDTHEGGSFVFDRNDYSFDQGLYSEMYCALFGTSSPNWWGDTVFDIDSYPVSSKTELALKTWNTNSESDQNLLKKAIRDDLQRFQNKNPDVEIESVTLKLYTGNISLEINITLTGNTDNYNYIYQKTKESLDNLPYTSYNLL